jgi:hypothetical protein
MFHQASAAISTMGIKASSSCETVQGNVKQIFATARKRPNSIYLQLQEKDPAV